MCDIVRFNVYHISSALSELGTRVDGSSYTAIDFFGESGRGTNHVTAFQQHSGLAQSAGYAVSLTCL